MLANTGTELQQEKANCHCNSYAKIGSRFMIGLGRLPCYREIDNGLLI